MEDVEKLVKTSLGEIERLLSTKTIVGEPITFEGNTIVPLISIGFAFGAGGGSGKSEKAGNGEGTGGGACGGGGIKPTAIIVINKDGVKIEPMKGTTVSILEKVGDAVSKVAEKRATKKDKE